MYKFIVDEGTDMTTFKNSSCIAFLFGPVALAYQLELNFAKLQLVGEIGGLIDRNSLCSRRITPSGFELFLGTSGGLLNVASIRYRRLPCECGVWIACKRVTGRTIASGVVDIIAHRDSLLTSLKSKLLIVGSSVGLRFRL
jgi:hypothetical protein